MPRLAPSPSHELADALFHFLFRNGPQAVISPHIHEPCIQLPWVQMETGFPLFNPSSRMGDF